MRKMLKEAIKVCITVDDSNQFVVGIAKDTSRLVEAVKEAQYHRLINFKPEVHVNLQASLDEVNGLASLTRTAAESCTKLRSVASKKLAAYVVGDKLPGTDPAELQKLQDSFRDSLREIAANAEEVEIIRGMAEELDNKLSMLNP